MELEEEKTAIVLPPSSLPIQSSDNAEAADEVDEEDEEEKVSNEAVILSPVEQESLIVSLNSTVKTTLYSIFTANVQVEELAKQFVDDPRFMKCIKEEIGSLGLYLNRSGKFDKSLHLVVYGLATNCIHVFIQRESTSIRPLLIWYNSNMHHQPVKRFKSHMLTSRTARKTS